MYATDKALLAWKLQLNTWACSLAK